MIKVHDLVSYLKKNKGKVIRYGETAELQVFSSELLQANIRREDKVLLKLEERNVGEYSIFLTNEEVLNDIYYSKGCVLKASDTIFNIYEVFAEHRNVEEVLIALLMLKNI